MIPLKTQRVNSVFTVNTVSPYDFETNVINYVGAENDESEPEGSAESVQARETKETEEPLESAPVYKSVTTAMEDLNTECVWIFGYGSLVWKVDFPYVERSCGHIKGFVRRFYQHSIDHRGTKEKPGRVVTLLPAKDSDATVWGVAYRIHADKVNEVLQQLDYREKNGYIRCLVNFYPYNPTNDGVQEEKRIILYVATEMNESYAGPAQIADIADQIYNACGPSGSNREYVFQLADAMRSMYPGLRDDHLFGLETILRYREKYETMKDVFKNSLPKTLLTAILSAEQENISHETLEHLIYREVEKSKRQDAEQVIRTCNRF